MNGHQLQGPGAVIQDVQLGERRGRGREGGREERTRWWSSNLQLTTYLSCTEQSVNMIGETRVVTSTPLSVRERVMDTVMEEKIVRILAGMAHLNVSPFRIAAVVCDIATWE